MNRDVVGRVSRRNTQPRLIGPSGVTYLPSEPIVEPIRPPPEYIQR